MGGFGRALVTLGALVLTAGSAVACPVCGSDTGRQVRAAVLDDFPTAALLTLLPFPVLGAAVLLIHYGPWWNDPHGPQTDDTPGEGR